MVEVNNRTRSEIDVKLIKKAAQLFLSEFQRAEADLSIALVGDRTIRRLNRSYRRIDAVTDVLSFPDPAGLGEIVLDYSQIKRQASEYGHTAQQELIFMLLHGLLHLVGFDDKKEPERERMIKTAQEFMKKHGFYDKI
jgi:probable rRNA maturation factor